MQSWKHFASGLKGFFNSDVGYCRLNICLFNIILIKKNQPFTVLQQLATGKDDHKLQLKEFYSTKRFRKWLWRTLWKCWTQKVERAVFSCWKWFHATGDGRDTTCSLWSNSVCVSSEVQRFKPSHNPRINTLRLENAAIWRMEMMQRVDNLCSQGPRCSLLAACCSLLHRQHVEKQARLRIFALLPSICVCVGMSCLLL